MIEKVDRTPVMELQSACKRFTGVNALTDVSFSVGAGEVLCLLGDNGAGKSTLINICSGVTQPTAGHLLMDGKEVVFSSPREAMSAGIATVHQEVGVMPLMSVGRNFFLGNELVKGWGPFKRMDHKRISSLALNEMRLLGITRVQNVNQLAVTMSGGERQALAVGRAMYFGARVLILDEPTSALGVKESAKVLDVIRKAKERSAAVIFITHNVYHAKAVADRYIVLIRGRVAASFTASEKTHEEIVELMAGGDDLNVADMNPDEGNGAFGLTTD